jgi:site-specific recombinase XerD
VAVEPHDGLSAGAGGHLAAGIPGGPHACPKSLRHGFGVQAVSRGIALNMVQKWLGHAQLTTTAIYANTLGEEEQSIAAKMWRDAEYG